MVTRNDIVNEARSWIGTRFQHQGRVKKTATHKGGCDCIGLVIGVMESTGCKTKDGYDARLFDRKDYGSAPDGEKLYQELSRHLISIAPAEIKPGDIGLFRFEKEPQHVAFFSPYPAGGLALIHCYAQARAVVEHRYDALWHGRLVQAFSIPHIEA